MTTSRRKLVAAGAAGSLAIPHVARAQAQPIKLVFSHHVAAAHMIHGVAEKFADQVKQSTNGQVTIDIRPAGQLFNLRTSAEALQLGTLDLCWSDLGTLANWQPQFGFTALPFLFNDYDHVKKVLYGPIGEQITKEAKDTLGVEILSLGASGFRVFVTKKEVKTAEDVRGIKLRVPEIPIYIEMARALGTNPTPIPTAEIYTAMQTGVVDGFEAPPDSVIAFKQYEVSKFATRTHHIFTEVSMMASAKKMASLPANVQKALHDAAIDTVATQMWEANLKEQAAAWTDLASKITANASPDIPSFRSKMGPVIDGFVAKAGPKARAYVEATQAAGKT